MSDDVAGGRLYGIRHSNRIGADLWGKNQFNSTFPAALCCYMRDHGESVVLLSASGNKKVSSSLISVNELFGTEEPSENLYFQFESRFRSYSTVINDKDLERVDLVISTKSEDEKGRTIAGDQIRALEVKLTVVPDSTTASDPEDKWAPEIVIRPATTKYCAMGMAKSCEGEKSLIREIFESKLCDVSDWGNETEASQILEVALNCLDKFEMSFREKQIPLVLQPIWKTEGKSPVLAKNSFDIFAWTDFALTRLIIDQARGSVGRAKISRPARSALRLARFLYEFGRAGNAHISNIYDSMTYGYQSDKDFAISGKVSGPYMKHDRRTNPKLPRSTVTKVILGGGEKQLSPERRFDQSVYFSYEYEAED